MVGEYRACLSLYKTWSTVINMQRLVVGFESKLVLYTRILPTNTGHLSRETVKIGRHDMY